jgi:hypothetical protein
LQVYQVLSWRGAGKISFSGHFAAAIRQPMAIGILGCNRNKTFKDEKRGTPHRVPLHHLLISAQKLNVIPVVAALMVAPPIVLLN